MKIVLTGGPSAGKTSAVEVLHRSHESLTTIVPEAASILFKGGFPRAQLSPFIICQQRAIFHVQKELEEMARLEAPGKAMICDRGSLDGLAYWPDSEASYFKAIHSTMHEQIMRYDWVIHLDTAAVTDYQLTGVRLEKATEAQVINEKVKRAWSHHPRRLIIPNQSNFFEKLDRVSRAVNMILAGANLKDIENSLNPKLA